MSNLEYNENVEQTECVETIVVETISNELTEINPFEEKIEADNTKIKLLGFRSGVKWKKIVSSVYLLLCNKFLMTEVFSAKNNYDGLWNFIVSKLEGIITFALMVSPYVLLSKSPVKDKLSHFINESKRANVYGIIVVCAAFILLANAVDMLYIKDDAIHSENAVITLKSSEDKPRQDESFIKTDYDEKGFEYGENTGSEKDKWEKSESGDQNNYFTVKGMESEKAEIHAQTSDKDVTSEKISVEEREEEETKEETDVISEVYVTPSGKKYHYSSSCAGVNGSMIGLYEAKLNYEPCKKCAK